MSEDRDGIALVEWDEQEQEAETGRPPPPPSRSPVTRYLRPGRATTDGRPRQYRRTPAPVTPHAPLVTCRHRFPIRMHVIKPVC